MKAWLDDLLNESTELQIAPLIDVVFLLLIYFMVSSSLKRSEADLSMSLPSSESQPQELKMPDEQIIEVLSNGRIVLNESQYSDASKADLAELEAKLIRYREASALMNVPAMITIAAEDDSRHERVIDVLNACAGAKITSVTFGTTE
ncbi:MAG: biopolymer transporter ExbD [Kiritimatiellaceae bacterium]|nr:biopolymer transporter ExbD [Kiritimatiellaceae bacterium]